MKQLVLPFITLFLSHTTLAQTGEPMPGKLLFKDDFNSPIDTINWIIEKSPGDSDIIAVKNGKLLLDTYGGATIWFSVPLSGNILITYKRNVIVNGGRNDRLSDLNQFWMATDSAHNRLFKSKGGFADYDSINMYYVGMGGNYNTTTRFRKYAGGDKKIIAEYKDAGHMLQPNKEYFIEIIMKDGQVQFIVDGKEYFSWKDEHPYTHGYFGIRSTRSRQEIDDVRIYQLK